MAQGQAVTQLCQNVSDITIYGTASASKHDALKDQLTSVFDHSEDYCQEIRK